MNDLSSHDRRLTALTWGLTFLWLGIFFSLPSRREGLFSVGMGLILLLENILRARARLRVSRFWVIVSLVFLAIGFLDFFNLRLLPVLLVVLGLWVIMRHAIRR